MEFFTPWRAKINEHGVVAFEPILYIASGIGSVIKLQRSASYATALKMDFSPYPYFATDPLLDSLRGDGEFSKLMDEARLTP